MISPAILKPMKHRNLVAATYAQPGGMRAGFASVRRFFSGREGNERQGERWSHLSFAGVGTRRMLSEHCLLKPPGGNRRWQEVYCRLQEFDQGWAVMLQGWGKSRSNRAGVSAVSPADRRLPPFWQKSELEIGPNPDCRLLSFQFTKAANHS